MSAKIWFVSLFLKLTTHIFSMVSSDFISIKSYQTICDMCNIPFFLTTEDGNVVFYNKKYSQAFFQGTLPDSTVLPEFLGGLKTFKKISENKIRLISASGKPELTEVEYFSALVKEIQCIGAIVKSTGDFLNLASFSTLNSTEMQELLDTDFDYILAVDKSMKHTFCSEDLAALLGYNVEEIYSIKSACLLDPSNRHAVLNALNKAVHAKNKEFNTVMALTDKGRSKVIFINFHARLFLDDNGKFAGLIGVAKNITAEMQVQVSEQAKIGLLDSAIQTVSSMLDNDIDTVEAIGDLFKKISQALGVSKICLAQNLDDNKAFHLVQSFENACKCSSMCECRNKRNYSMCMDEETIIALQHNKSVVSSQNETPMMSRFMKRNGIQSLAYIPVFIHKRFWGFLTVQDCINHRIWEASEIATLKLIAICVSSVLSLQDKVAQSEETSKALSAAIEIVKSNTLHRTALLQQENEKIRDSLSRGAN